ncbi:ribose 5-phosphate isomerase B [Limnochorda pilosa]|uniref:Ribose-5-phosphate isomerase n=1 Tax=Limnochorda pilosa TaxID=1555112 RepID=A0A0K2SP97_LIMPI|nr:ribose 5-phosphate isomerase B [Limnochorda pilosa]BAS28926.1 ribose-5-phosphate isomerase [Limnochorda pilosa]
MESVLFVCSGNTCRSVMAEALLRKRLQEGGPAGPAADLAARVASAGLHASEGAPATEPTRQVLRERGVELADQRARRLRPEMVAQADWIVAMTADLRDEIRRRHPEKADRIVTLLEVAGSAGPGGSPDVPDPYGLPLEHYRQTADLLEAALPGLISFLERGRKERVRMQVAVGSDHAGYPLKEAVVGLLKEMGLSYRDFGTTSEASVDYPDFGRAVAEAVARGEYERGIVICGTGIGMSIVANKVPGVRAALCHEPYSARMSRLHNDANVLAMGGRIVGPALAREVARAFLETDFEGGRHQRRLEKIAALEREREGGNRP